MFKAANSLFKVAGKNSGKIGKVLSKNTGAIKTAGKVGAGLTVANIAGVNIPIASDLFNSGADLIGLEVGQEGLIGMLKNNPNLLLLAGIGLLVLII